jgi:hypothetical protein
VESPGQCREVQPPGRRSACGGHAHDGAQPHGGPRRQTPLGEDGFVSGSQRTNVE